MIHHRADPGLQPISVQHTTHQQPHPTRNVEADTAGGDDPVGVDVGGRHAADRKPVSPVHVGHRIGCPDDSWQRRHVGHLGQRHILVFVGQQRSRREHDPRYAHRALLFYPEPVRGFLDDLRAAHLTHTSSVTEQRQPCCPSDRRSSFSDTAFGTAPTWGSALASTIVNSTSMPPSTSCR